MVSQNRNLPLIKAGITASMSGCVINLYATVLFLVSSTAKYDRCAHPRKWWSECPEAEPH